MMNYFLTLRLMHKYYLSDEQKEYKPVSTSRINYNKYNIEYLFQFNFFSLISIGTNKTTQYII